LRPGPDHVAVRLVLQRRLRRVEGVAERRLGIRDGRERAQGDHQQHPARKSVHAPEPMLRGALGAMAEWLRSGLQSRVHRFDSRWRLYWPARSSVEAARQSAANPRSTAANSGLALGLWLTSTSSASGKT